MWVRKLSKVSQESQWNDLCPSEVSSAVTGNPQCTGLELVKHCLTLSFVSSSLVQRQALAGPTLLNFRRPLSVDKVYPKKWLILCPWSPFLSQEPTMTTTKQQLQMTSRLLGFRPQTWQEPKKLMGGERKVRSRADLSSVVQLPIPQPCLTQIRNGLKGMKTETKQI